MRVVEIIEKISEFMQTSGTFGVIIACILMSIESIFPMIPLALLITINMVVMGKVVGFFVPQPFPF